MRTSIVILWAIILTVISGTIFYHKVNHLELPLTPDEGQPAWKVEAKITFPGTNNAKITFLVPSQTPGFKQLSQEFYSGNYGLAIDDRRDIEDGNLQLKWTTRRAKGTQSLYYWVSVTKGNIPETWNQKPPLPQRPDFKEPYSSAITTLLESVREESADIETYTRELLIQLNKRSADEHVTLLRNRSSTPEQWAVQIVDILKGVRIPARLLWGLSLKESGNHAKLFPLLQVYNGDKWLTYDIETARPGIPENFLVWYIGSDPLVQIDGFRKNIEPEVTFSITKTDAKSIDVANLYDDSVLVDFSLLSLPVENQNVYKIILVVPIGALLVAFLRTMIGISTFGTFMPVLIALAFRETQLLAGVILFSVIIFLGLSLRFYLEKLRLLLVPRLAAILVIVVILMVGISVVTNKLQLERALSLSLFPMVILAMTIERMSIVWEESGAKDALIKGAGSLMVACLGYLVMTNPYVSHIMFVFPELLLTILAICLLMGRYTGYRLTELRRFRHMTKGEL